jgi:cation:H+ antiporter
MGLTPLVFLAGLGLLTGGAALLVRGASRLAATLGISPLVIGLTVVAYGTSTPELAVGVRAALAGQAEIALGNVVGSNIFNVLFILGVSALIVPLVVAQQFVRLDVPIMIGVSLLVLILALDGMLTRLDGLVLLGSLAAYTVFVIRQSRGETAAIEAEYAREYGAGATSGRFRIPVQVASVVIGLGLLVLGARWLVDAAVVLARALGLSELVIGLTIVAAGTSLPDPSSTELAVFEGMGAMQVCGFPRTRQ